MDMFQGKFPALAAKVQLAGVRPSSRRPSTATQLSTVPQMVPLGMKRSNVCVSFVCVLIRLPDFSNWYWQ